MNDDMDFYDPLPPTDSLSLQEMIECDMRTQIYDGHDLDSPVHMNELDFADADPLRGDRLGHMHNHNHPHLDVSALDVKLDSDLNLACDTNLTWVSSNVCRLSSPSPLGGRISSGGGNNLDFDPGSLLVNPQTGLPITLVSAQLRPSSGNRHDSGSLWRRPRSNGVSSRLDVAEDSDSDAEDKPYVLVNPSMTASPVLPVRKRCTATTTTTILVSDSTDDDDDDDDPTESEEDDDEDEEPASRYYNGKAKLNTLNGGGSRGGGKSAASGNHSDVSALQRERAYPKPAYSYSCLIAMALKNSKAGSLPVSEIYSFMTENFPYFKTAPNGWKNSVRHNLSLNKCFEKIEKPATGTNQRKGCLWAMNPNKVEKMEEEVVKWGKKDPNAIKQSMARPEYFELLEKGCLKPKSELGEVKVVAAPPKREPPPSETRVPKTDNLKVVAKIKTEPTSHDTVVLESNLYLDNSLLDLNVQGDLWEELDDKMDFDIPLSNDGLPSIQSCFASDVNDKSMVLAGSSDAEKLAKSETMFFAKHIRAFSATAMK